MTDNATVRTVEHGEASRLPDTSWLWRRILIYLVIIVCLAIAWRVSERVTDIGTLRQILRYAFGMMALGLMLYGVGSTVTDVAALVTAFLSTKRTTVTSAPPPATVTDGRAEAPAEPPAAPAADEQLKSPWERQP
jgi:uncharacterized membrane protein YcjF (UPF0283 family)